MIFIFEIELPKQGKRLITMLFVFKLNFNFFLKKEDCKLAIKKMR